MWATTEISRSLSIINCYTVTIPSCPEVPSEIYPVQINIIHANDLHLAIQWHIMIEKGVEENVENVRCIYKSSTGAKRAGRTGSFTTWYSYGERHQLIFTSNRFA